MSPYDFSGIIVILPSFLFFCIYLPCSLKSPSFAIFLTISLVACYCHLHCFLSPPTLAMIHFYFPGFCGDSRMCTPHSQSFLSIHVLLPDCQCVYFLSVPCGRLSDNQTNIIELGKRRQMPSASELEWFQALDLLPEWKMMFIGGRLRINPLKWQ